MHFVSKCFDDLTTGELYEILKARSAVFVVEQNCLPPRVCEGTRRCADGTGFDS